EVLRSPRFSELLEEARRHYHYVLLDTPPLVAVPDGRVITKAVDGVLLVIGAHRTPRKLLEEALALVEPANLLGLVYNQDDRPLPGYYRGYYGAHALATNGHGTSRWERLVRRGRRGGPREEPAAGKTSMWPDPPPGPEGQHPPATAPARPRDAGAPLPPASHAPD